MRLLALLPLLPACAPLPYWEAGTPYTPPGYRHVDHTPPAEAVIALRERDAEATVSAMRVRDGCYYAFIDGNLVPLAPDGRQICLI